MDGEEENNIKNYSRNKVMHLKDLLLEYKWVSAGTFLSIFGDNSVIIRLNSHYCSTYCSSCALNVHYNIP